MSQAEAVMLAVQHSPQARAAKAARDAAQAQADRDKPAARPTLTATASGTAQGPRVVFPRPDYTPATVLPEGAARLDLVLEQMVYRAGIGAAKQRYAAQSALVTEDYRKTLSDLALTVRKAIMDVLRAQSGVRTAQDGLDAALRYQQTVDAQIRAGVAKPVDAETVIAQVAEAQEGVETAQGGLSLAQFAFNKAVGRSHQYAGCAGTVGRIARCSRDARCGDCVCAAKPPGTDFFGIEFAGGKSGRLAGAFAVTARR